MWILTFENSENAHFLKIRRPFSKVKVYRHCEFWLSKIQKYPIFKTSAAHFQNLKFTGIVNFDFRKFKKCAFFLKIRPPHFQKLKFTGIVNFDFRKCKKCEVFKKICLPHFQKLMFTGTVNFVFRKCKKSEFF